MLQRVPFTIEPPTSRIPQYQFWLAHPGQSGDLPELPPPPTSFHPWPCGDPPSREGPLLPQLQLRRPRPSSSMEGELLFAGAAGHDGSMHARGQAVQRQRCDVRLRRHGHGWGWLRPGTSHAYGRPRPEQGRCLGLRLRRRRLSWPAAGAFGSWCRTAGCRGFDRAVRTSCWSAQQGAPVGPHTACSTNNNTTMPLRHCCCSCATTRHASCYRTKLCAHTHTNTRSHTCSARGGRRPG